MKAVIEIIMAFVLMVGVVFTSNFVLREIRQETLIRIHKGPSSLEKFTYQLTK